MSIPNIPLILNTESRMTIREYMAEWNKLAEAIENAKEQSEVELLLKCLVEVRNSVKLSDEVVETAVRYGLANRQGGAPRAQARTILQAVLAEDVNGWHFVDHKVAIKNWRELSGNIIKLITDLPLLLLI